MRRGGGSKFLRIVPAWPNVFDSPQAHESYQGGYEMEINKQNPEKTLPSCTTAPSAEHARASNEDEPCDDARGAEKD